MPVSLSIESRLMHQHESIFTILQGISAGDLNKKVYEEKWSIWETLAHIGRTQDINWSRIKSIIGGTTFPVILERYVAEEDTEGFNQWLQMASFETLQAELLSRRAKLNTFINHLNDHQLTLTGVHPLYGLMSLHELLEFFLLHEAHHIFYIFKIAAQIKQQNAQAI